MDKTRRISPVDATPTVTGAVAASAAPAAAVAAPAVASGAAAVAGAAVASDASAGDASVGGAALDTDECGEKNKDKNEDKYKDKKDKGDAGEEGGRKGLSSGGIPCSGESVRVSKSVSQSVRVSVNEGKNESIVCEVVSLLGVSISITPADIDAYDAQVPPRPPLSPPPSLSLIIL